MKSFQLSFSVGHVQKTQNASVAHNSNGNPNSARKGEVSDLKMQLRQLAGSRAPGTDDSKRDLYKKVISYMTIGIDVSSLFSEMVMCSATSDIVLKKMCYLYVGNYARETRILRYSR